MTVYLQRHAELGEVLDAEPAESNQQSVTFRNGKYLFKFQGDLVTGVRKL